MDGLSRWFSRRLRHWSPNLFWRTFLLILSLIVISLLAWLQSFRALDPEPRTERAATQIVSIVNITRAALRHSDPDERARLLAQLAANVGIQVTALEPDDKVIPLDGWQSMQERVRARLGEATLLGGAVNAVPGVWVSFDIEGDAYWAHIQRDLLMREIGNEWLVWSVVATLLSLFAAVVIARLVNQPLRRLSQAARLLGSGRRPATLPPTGPPEIRMVNRSFNRMVADLAKIEQDRALLLAGISHDLRTPLTRLRLELEMSNLPDEVCQPMIDDLGQMEAIIGQFLEYARTAPQNPPAPIDLTALTAEAIEAARLDSSDSVTRAIAPGITIGGYDTELRRALANLIVNAQRYGRSADGMLRLGVELRAEADQILLSISDQGAGIAPERAQQLIQPFERGDAARADTSGAGLGLAIVARVARLHGGELTLQPNVPSGLCAQLRFPKQLPKSF
jgi:two-component system osmolarity sensor histidine kinase EnvZ